MLRKNFFEDKPHGVIADELNLPLGGQITRSPGPGEVARGSAGSGLMASLPTHHPSKDLMLEYGVRDAA